MKENGGRPTVIQSKGFYIDSDAPAERGLTPREMNIMAHSLGLRTGDPIPDETYRNYYASDPRGVDIGVIKDLATREMMERGRDIPGGLVYFHVTEKGKEVLRSYFGRLTGKGK